MTLPGRFQRITAPDADPSYIFANIMAEGRKSTESDYVLYFTKAMLFLPLFSTKMAYGQFFFSHCHGMVDFLIFAGKLRGEKWA
jgi:hypothetical protein